MVQTAITFALTAGSVLLLGYWFRYTCLLILTAKTTRDYAGEFASANQLSFLQVQEMLRSAGPANLDELNASLDRDYARVSELLTSGGQELQVEDRMLQANYRVTKMWYQSARHFSPKAARNALNEMSMMVSHFANSVGERASAGSVA